MLAPRQSDRQCVLLAGILFLVLGLSGHTAIAAGEPGVPATGALSFSVLRDGDDIGTHVVRFSDRGDGLAVDISTDVRVSLPLVNITLYEFVHEGHEIWRNGQLLELRSETNDDGADKSLSVTRAGDRLDVRGSDGSHPSAASIVPASLWNPALRNASILLNTLDSSEMAVTVSSLGFETIEAGGAGIEAEHVKLTGELERELWYTRGGVLVGVRFLGDDGSEITYVLQ